MSKLSKLIQVTDAEKKAILQHYNITEEEFDEYVQKLKEWASQCEHLPQEEDFENKCKICLLNSKMSVEKAKKSLEGYYRIRAMYSNEFFDRLLPSSEEYQMAKKCVKTVVMPKLTPDLCRLTIFKLCDPNGEAPDAYLYEFLVIMMAELRLQNGDMHLSNIIIVDYDDYSWKNLMKFTPTISQKLVDMLVSVNLRIKAIHFVNIPNIMDQVMKFLKMFLPAKLVQRIYSHQSHEQFWEHIPREYLPSDYGGTEKSIQELYDAWCQQIEESEEMFKRLLTVKSSQKFELDQEQQNLFGCGVEGSFKKLAVD